MPHDIPWETRVQQHPGSSSQEIDDEPDWSKHEASRIGYRNQHEHHPGLTHAGDDHADDEEGYKYREKEVKFDRNAKIDFQTLQKHMKDGDLVNFRDVILGQRDLHLQYPENKPLGWRYVLDTTEQWVKQEEPWPANIKKKKQEEEKKAEEQKKKKKEDGQDDKNGSEKDGDEKAGKKSKGTSSDSNGQQADGKDDKDANASQKGQNGDGNGEADNDTNKGQQNGDDTKTRYQKLREKFSAQEIALLDHLEDEKNYRYQLKQNDGKRESPQKHNRTSISIDEQDQFSPDSWLPRSDELIRLTGKHPLNAEAELTALFEGGLITPNELHYVRNHGAVPKLLWEYHTIDVENGALTLSMDDLKEKYENVNVAVSLACDGNRRKELNMIKRSKGFNWGSGATGCAYWKGPLLRDILIAAGVKAPNPEGQAKKQWVNFQGADEPSEGAYETCVPLEYVMDPTNDVLLAHEMNNVPLPPDHGYPVRCMIPGFVGGRCVKWLKKIWISDQENTSYYHIWDNRVLPSFVTEKEGEFAEALFAHPSTACNEQNLNSVIARPAQGEEVSLDKINFKDTYRIAGYAYDGGGHEVQRVEVSLDDGETWLYCLRRFPDYPIRHGRKFWTWIHWYIDVSMVDLVQAKSITVRAWNVFKNTQPETPTWNVMGMMNNSWYILKQDVTVDKDSGKSHLIFRHPTEPGTADGGWMKPPKSDEGSDKDADTPDKQFTRQEIEKHSSEDDCWLVVDNKVYDATSVISWHPGGKAAIVGHAGKVHQETTDEFASVHDDYAYSKLKECILGSVTVKAASFIKANAEAMAKEKAKSKNASSDVALQKHRWVPVKMLERKELSEDTRQYTLALPEGIKKLGLGCCRHLQFGFHLRDKMLIRSYTPTAPLFPPAKELNQEQQKKCKDHKLSDLQDGKGIFEVVIKTYLPTSEQPGGAMSNILDCVEIGEEIDVRGPTGEIEYKGNGEFAIGDADKTFKKINLILGGSGLTPGFALVGRTLLDTDPDIQIRVVDANKSEADILLHEELNRFEKESNGRIKITHVLSHPSDEWQGQKGHVNADVMKASLFPPSKDTASFLCGPPAMIQKAALPALKDWGFEEGENIFGF